MGKVVDFWCLALAVPVRWQNETTFTHDILSTQQKLTTRISTDYTTKVGEKKQQFLDMRKGSKSKESKIEVYCSWFAGPTCSPYFIAPARYTYKKCVMKLN